MNTEILISFGFLIRQVMNTFNLKRLICKTAVIFALIHFLN